MPRTRVHNMNVSLDGYAAGEHVTFDAPIGGAERLFTWFDGRVIHGVDKANAPVTLDRASDQHVEPGHRRRDHGMAASSVPRLVTGPTTGGGAGGATSRHSRHRCSS